MAVTRDEKGRVLPGSVLNPLGRPKDPESITAWIKQFGALTGPDGRTMREVLIRKLWSLANNGDLRAMEMIINRTDGLLTQQIQQLTTVEIIEVSDEEWAGTEPDAVAETSAVPEDD